MDILRRAILEPGPPENFALKTVQEVIKPQKQTKLVQDENQLLENILRTLLQELVSAAVQSGEKIMEYGQSIVDGDLAQGQIPRLLDIVLYLCEKEHVEAGMIFQLLEDLTEMSTMRNCKDVFRYIESKQDILGKVMCGFSQIVTVFSYFVGTVRTRKACDVENMQSASSAPIKAVNIKGVFNTSNETKYEKEAPEGISIDFNFYKTFWSLQEHFCNPASLTQAPAKWQKFTSSLMVVLNTFEAQPLSDEEGNANNLEDEAATFSIKYLTSSKLMGLELKDPSFRRHVLVQCLILFDYLKAPGKNDKDLPSETMKEEVKSCEDRVKNLLELTPPKGKEFLGSIEHILERERNWVWWKRDGCPAFEKPPIEKKSVQDGVKKRCGTCVNTGVFVICLRKKGLTYIPPNQQVWLPFKQVDSRPRWRLGNKELAHLWKWADQNPKALTDSQRVRTPAVTEYWKPLAGDMDVTAGIEAEYHHKNNRVYCWKGLRFSARQDLEGFSRFTEHGIEGVVPLELLAPGVRSKYQPKPSDRSKRAKKEESKGAAHQAEEGQFVTPTSEIDVEGSRADLEASAAPMDTDAAITENLSRDGTPDEHQKHSSDMEPGQIEADVEAETGMVDGETDAEVDLDAVG
ncbi:hypothetical protein RHMOL_Rhmol07G0082300 [Rhododendron molle]|uniref:Uncharacterized protein n=1 Tax=Rhododendron molle TaxID=49168 RepID=A0ACC0N0F8_RHOML|nr:hypothetical protein RHMOL_Rhmol07G0082300 [Rhododendron molle]